MILNFMLKGQCRRGKGGQQHRKGQVGAYPTKEWAAWRDDMVLQLRCQKAGGSIIVPCKLSVVFRHGDKRQRNVAGMVDALMHCLERAQIIEHDELIEALEVDTAALVDKGSAGVMLRIETEYVRTA